VNLRKLAHFPPLTTSTKSTKSTKSYTMASSGEPPPYIYILFNSHTPFIVADSSLAKRQRTQPIGHDGILHDEPAYQEFFEKFNLELKDGSFYFHETCKTTFEYMLRFLKTGPFRNLTDILSNRVIAFLVTTDSTDYISRLLFTPLEFAPSSPGRTLILVGLDPDTSAMVPQATGRVADIVVTGSLFASAINDTVPIVTAVAPVVAAAALPTQPCNCIIEQGIRIDNIDPITVAVMSFTAQHVEADDFMVLFNARFPPKYYPVAVYTGAMLTGNIDFVATLLDTVDRQHFCLIPFAIVGIALWWSINLDNQDVDLETYRLPDVLLNENAILRTLDIIDQHDHLPSILTSLVIKMCDLDLRTPPFRQAALIFWTWAEETNDLSPIPESFSGDIDLLRTTTNHILRINDMNELVKWEALLAVTETPNTTLLRLRLIIHMVTTCDYPFILLSSSREDLTHFIQIWVYLENLLDDVTGRLLSFDTLRHYSHRLIYMLGASVTEAFIAMNQTSLNARFITEATWTVL